MDNTTDISSPTMVRLEDQIQWYDLKSGRNQTLFKALKMGTFVSGALVPIFVFLSWGRICAALVGSLVVVLEGMQQLNQYQANWIAYRSTCETLKHEKYLYLALAGPYSNCAQPLSLLAERVESLVSQEHAKWASAQEQSQRFRTSPS